MDKVIMFTERWATGGIESVIMNIIRNTQRYEFEILVSQKISDLYDAELEEKKYKIKKIIDKKGKVFPLLRLFKNIKSIKKNLKDDSNKIIHINMAQFYGLIYARVAKKYGAKKVIVHAHSSGFNNDKFNLKNKVNKLMVNIFDSKDFLHVTCSEKAADFCFSNKYSNNAIFLPNAINMEKFYYDEKVRKDKRKNLNWENKFVIGNIGRFVEQKNHRFIIDVFEKVQKYNENAILVLIGNGKLKNIIESYILEKNLQEKVIIFEKRTDVNQIYQAFDVFLLPSLYEGLPVVSIEAQTSDLPCIFADTITKQANFSNNIEYISLNKSIDFWAEKIKSKESYKRRNKKSEYNDSIFNVKNIETAIISIYEIKNGGFIYDKKDI